LVFSAGPLVKQRQGQERVDSPTELVLFGVAAFEFDDSQTDFKAALA